MTKKKKDSPERRRVEGASLLSWSCLRWATRESRPFSPNDDDDVDVDDADDAADAADAAADADEGDAGASLRLNRAPFGSNCGNEHNKKKKRHNFSLMPCSLIEFRIG